MKHQLEKIKWGIIPITTYRGISVTKTKDGYMVFEVPCKTPEDVDDLINAAHNHVKNSLQKDTTQQ